jgi:hypothetical protein
VVAALNGQGDRSPFALVGSLPHKGAAPLVLLGHAEAPTDSARGGAAVGSLQVSRAVIDDVVKFVMGVQ